MFLSARCSLLRAVGIFCSLDVLYGGRGIGKKIVFFFLRFLFIKTLDPDPDRYR
jgi:hypothetical protein